MHTLIRSKTYLPLILVAALFAFLALWQTAYAQDGDRPDAPVGGESDVSQPSPITSQGVMADDGYTHWRLDLDTICRFSDHNYVLNIQEDPAILSEILLTANTWDVDYRDPKECKRGPEVDPAVFNGFPLGNLTGAHNSWSLNGWNLTVDQVVKGPNRFHVSTDSTKTGCWCVGIGYLDLRAKVGFDIVKTSPADDERQVDFHADKARVDVTFSAPLDRSTVNSQTFSLFYRDSGGAFHQVPGSFTFDLPNQFTFKPSANLKDGVRYYVTVDGGASGVKSAGGATLNALYTWSFWTVPDLSLTDNFLAEGRSYCGPSPAPCRGVEIVVIQVARDAALVPYKDTVARIYVRWRWHSDVYDDDQVEEMKVKAVLRLGDATIFDGAVTLKRPDLYSHVERSLTRNTINVFHTPTDKFNYSVTITPLGGANPLAQVSSSSPRVNYTKPVVTFEHYFLRAGDWKTGVPDGAKTQQTRVIQEGAQLVDDMFPVLSAAPLIMGELPVDYSVLATTTPINNCGAVREVMCTMPNGTKVKMSEFECIDRRALTVKGSSKLMTVSIPRNVCPNAVGMRPHSSNILYLMAQPVVSRYVLPHETGHFFGISVVNEGSPRHRNNPDGIEGFQVRLRSDGNRSREESLNKPLSLMQQSQDPLSATYWIHNDDYAALLNTVTAQALAEEGVGPYLIVAGVVDVDAGSVRLDAVFQRDDSIDTPADSGACTAALLDGANQVLTSVPFTPDAESDPFRRSSPGQELAPAAGPAPFGTSLPWDEAARSLQIACNGAVLLTQPRGAAAPMVNFTNLAEGAILSGQKQLTWAGSDGDGSALAYQLQFSDDGDTWRPLSLLGSETSYRLDTTVLPSGSNRKLRILVSDGFDTIYATRAVTITNPLMVLSVSPQPYAEDVSVYTSVQLRFNTPVDPQTLTAESVQIMRFLDPISATLNLDDNGRLLTLQPLAPLRTNTSYDIRISSALKDITGSNVRFGSYNSSFTTEADTTPPYVLATYPQNGATNVPRRALIQASLNEEMGIAAGVSTMLTVQNAAGQAVTGSVYRPYEDTSRVVFRPSQDLAPNTTYTATLAPAAPDTAGNPLGEASTWHFTTGADRGQSSFIIGNYFDEAMDKDGDGLYDELDIYVDVQTYDAYDLNGRLVDRNGQLIQWAQGEPEKRVSIGGPAVGVNRFVLRFDGDVIRAHNLDGPYYLDALHYYPRPSPFIPLVPQGEVHYMAYGTLPYHVADFAGVLSFMPLPDRLVEWNSSHEDEWNLRDYTIDVARPVAEVSYTIIGNTDPRLGVSIDASANIDIQPQTSVETNSDVTVKGCDTAGNCAEGVFTVRVQRPQAVTVVAPPTVRMSANASRTIEVEIQDQWGRGYMGEEITLNVLSQKKLGVVTPTSLTTNTGRATVTYQAGAVQGSDAIVFQIPGRTYTVTTVAITNPVEVYLPLSAKQFFFFRP